METWRKEFTWRFLQDLKPRTTPIRFVDSKNPCMVLNNHPDLGLRDLLELLGYLQGQADHTLFVKHSKDQKVVILVVYVDDIIVMRIFLEEMDRLKEAFARDFEIKDIGAVK